VRLDSGRRSCSVRATSCSDHNITTDDVKAQAQLDGVRITAASVAAARLLLSRVGEPPIHGAPTLLHPH
jgi:hypothetical protein